MRVTERFLTILSWDPYKQINPNYDKNKSIENSLTHFVNAFEGFSLTHFLNKSVLDFGCGQGHQAVAISLAGTKRVLGIDINDLCIEKAR